MANPTSAFGWQMPTSTDLVTDLPADFEVFGQAVDTSLADLKGGTTGQVLSKATNADMDFTWVTTDDANAIQNSIVDAKGDLIAASANDTPARLAVGANGETLVADSSTSTGLRYQGSMAAGRNAVINGGFDVWQRGTSFALAANTAIYCTDRFMAYSVAGGRTVSRQVTNDSTNLPFIQYATRLQRDNGNSATDQIRFVMSLETVNSIPLAGKPVAFSFYARVGANYSGGALTNQVRTGTGTDQNLLTAGYTGGAFPSGLNNTATLTTTWQRFTYTGTTAGTTTEIGIEFSWIPTGTAGANDWVEITGIQLEVGSVPTQFTRTGGSIQGETSACQRYCLVVGGNAAYERFGFANSYNATNGFILSTLPITMRTTPTLSYSALTDWGIEIPGVTSQNLTALSISNSSPSFVNLGYTTASDANFGVGKAALFRASNTTNARLTFSAEL